MAISMGHNWSFAQLSYTGDLPSQGFDQPVFLGVFLNGILNLLAIVDASLSW